MTKFYERPSQNDGKNPIRGYDFKLNMAKNYEQPTFDKFEFFDIANFINKFNFLKSIDIMFSII